MSDKPYVVPDTVSRTIGREAQRNNILAARVIADIVKTTLGPKGMDKMLVDSSGNVVVTNDGVTILEEMELDHPAAKLIVDIAKTQESEVGDGTTTVALLAGKLLEQAEKLLDRRIHPTVIIRGYRKALAKALALYTELSMPVTSKELLEQIAMTAMTGKGAEGTKEQFAKLIVSAIDHIAEGKLVDPNGVRIEKIRGTQTSELIEGIVLNKERANQDMPSRIEEARIVLIDVPLEIRNPETETKVSISSPEQLRSFLESEELYLKTITKRIIDSGANVVFCQKGIDDVAQYYLAQSGIMAFRRISRADMEQLAKATSAKIIANLNDLLSTQLGYAQIVEEVREGEEAMTYVRGCKNPRAVTIVVYGSTLHGMDELERAIKDGIGVVSSAVRDGRVVAGGGAVEIALARKLREYARTLTGKEQLAAEEFASALETIPETLAENAGLDPIEMLTELRKRHELGNAREGINLLTDRIEDCFAAGVVEPLRVKTQALSAATEVATMLLRIDDVLISRSSSPTRQSMPEMDD